MIILICFRTIYQKQTTTTITLKVRKIINNYYLIQNNDVTPKEQGSHSATQKSNRKIEIVCKQRKFYFIYLCLNIS